MKSFVEVSTSTRIVKEGETKELVVFIKPVYRVEGKDIMRKGGKFYAILNRDTNLWEQNPEYAYYVIDKTITDYYFEHFKQDAYGTYRNEEGLRGVMLLINNSESGSLFEFNKWFNNLSDNFNYISLDADLTFKSTKVTPTMYRSKRLPYDLTPGPMENYEKLIGTLYLPAERDKLEWAIGCVLSGDSKKVDKMIVIYSYPGFGKGTILNIIKAVFKGYWAAFQADSLASGYQFATAAFKDNPLVAIHADGGLQKIESPIINEIISHEEILVNEKNTKHYMIRPNAMLFLATNDFVDLHDTKVGITRRLIDVYPSGNKLEIEEYKTAVNGVEFEIPAIAHHCLNRYKEMGVNYYQRYRPSEMIKKTNLLQNFLADNLTEIGNQEYCTLPTLYLQFKNYCEESGYSYPPKRNVFCEQLREYFEEYHEYKKINGKTTRNVYEKLKINKILGVPEEVKHTEPTTWIDLQEQPSALDKLYSDVPAQYDVDGRPANKWVKCKTTLKEIDPHKYHWFKLPENVIKIDFDKRGSNGEKSLEENIKAANKYPKTYCEVSKSGCGLHLYYIWEGDVNELSHLAEDNVEVKVSTGNNAHRRILTKCNNLPVAHLSTGLPLKENKKVVTKEIVTNEKGLRTTITKNLNKQIHGDTRSSIDHIYYILEQAYSSGVVYDVSDMFEDIYWFAANSTNQSDYCRDKVAKMHFKSESESIPEKSESSEVPIIFFDIEQSPNVQLLCWMYDDDDAPVNTIFNPTAEQISEFYGMGRTERALIGGFNNRSYDDHILYGRLMGDTIEECYDRSNCIINGDDKVSNAAKFGQAYHMSDFDVYDFAKDKMSLKKWEIKLKLPHLEFDIPWDQPVPEEEWPRLAEYCANDVRATRAVFHECYGDYIVRKVLAEISGLEVIDTNRQHITKMIIGDDKEADHVYTDLATGIAEDKYGIPYPLDPNVINRFPGYERILNEKGKWINWYRDTDVGYGGYVYAEPGMYSNVALLDVGNMHGASILALNKFGKHTENYRAIREARMAIKHHDYETASKMFDGKFAKYLNDDEMADALEGALKLVLNSTYGIAAGTFANPLKDPRDKNNIIALRGALFMRTLQDEVAKRGFTVAHIKTDSIKIPNATPEIIEYVINFGRLYGYEFEHEATYERMCLVNDAVYIAKYDDKGVRNKGGKHAGKWTATGTQFQVPYVFKTLFSHEPIIFDDKCETKSCSTAFYLDLNENLPEGSHDYRFVGRVGQFSPILPGHGAGVLLRKSKDGSKYDSANGTKGYLWMESEVVKARGLEEYVDESYYRRLVDDAVETISKFGSFDAFVNLPFI